MPLKMLKKRMLPMSRTTIFLLNILCWGVLASSTASGRPPNIVVIVADDLGCCDMALYDGWVETSRIEQMADQGMLFTDFLTYLNLPSRIPSNAA